VVRLKKSELQMELKEIGICVVCVLDVDMEIDVSRCN
jgi:hypothetical protein